MTFIEALDNLMPGFDREVAKLAQRLLIQSRPIDYHTGVIATKVTPGEAHSLLSGVEAGRGHMRERGKQKGAVFR